MKTFYIFEGMKMTFWSGLFIGFFITSCGVKNYGFFHNRSITFSHNEKNTSADILFQQKDTFLLEEKNYYPIASLLTDYIPQIKRKKNKIVNIMDSIPKKDSCDIIFLQNGISFLAVVTKQTATSIVYKKCGSSSEFQEVINASEVKYIQYKDSNKERMRNILMEQKIEHSKRMQKLTLHTLLLSLLPIGVFAILISISYYTYQQNKRTPEQKVLDAEIQKSKKTEPFGIISFISGILSIVPVTAVIITLALSSGLATIFTVLPYIVVGASLASLSLVFGIKSIQKLKNKRDIYKGWAFPMIGLCYGAYFLLILLIITTYLLARVL